MTLSERRRILGPPDDGGQGVQEIAVAYHGTTAEAAEAILREGFKTSENTYDWLGDGIYFFQGPPERAREWAVEHCADPAVIGCEIAIVDFLDLTNPEWTRFLTEQYDQYLTHCREVGEELPVQRGKAHRLDREVINYSVGALRREGVPVRGVRGVFIEGDVVYPDSAIYALAHVQIAVLDATVIRSIELVPWTD